MSNLFVAPQSASVRIGDNLVGLEDEFKPFSDIAISFG
jgi:hypothetical protein